MTYCLGMLLDAGLILMADTRTNAGIDDFSSFRKLHVLAQRPDREIYAATAGNLSVSQSVVTMLQEDQAVSEDDRQCRCLGEVDTMFQAAQVVGAAVARVASTVGAPLESAHIDSSIELLVGGRVGAGPLQLFLVYSIGNFIECTSEVPFLQIGERKYGRPILDRALRYRTSLPEAVKIGFLSFDGAMKSNLGVAHPIDLLVLPEDSREPAITRRVEKDDVYFAEITRHWANLLRDGVESLPGPPWMEEGGRA